MSKRQRRSMGVSPMSSELHGRDAHATLALQDAINRRTFLKRSAAGIGIAALGALLGDSALANPTENSRGLPGLPHFPAKAKRVIYLFQSGAPSQLDLFDYK